MKIDIEIKHTEILKLICDFVESTIGHAIDPSEVTLLVRSKENYRQTVWEKAELWVTTKSDPLLKTKPTHPDTEVKAMVIHDKAKSS